MNFLGLGQSASIEIKVDDLDNRKHVEVKCDGNQRKTVPVFYDGESISGLITVSIKRGNKVEYQGIKIEFIGQIDFYADRGSRDDFLTRSVDLARPGILSQTTTYPFNFTQVAKPFESYTGSNVSLRYFLKVTIVKRLMNMTKEFEVLVHSFPKTIPNDSSIQMEVGIEDSLHIEFEYNKSNYHLNDVIVGKIFFLLVRVKIKYMEIQILKRETTGLGVNAYSDLETLAKYEIMDGAPVRGESIPIRLFLAGYDLSPTMKDVNRKFSVRYSLNLVLLDEEDRRYYKQQEILLYRKPERRRVVQAEGVALHSPKNTTLLTQLQPATPPDEIPEKQEVPDLADALATKATLATTGENGHSDPDVVDNGDAEQTPLPSGASEDAEASPSMSRAARSMHRYEPDEATRSREPPPSANPIEAPKSSPVPVAEEN